MSDRRLAQAEARLAAVETQVGYLERVSEQIREQGDVQQVYMDETGVAPTVSLADELWLIAYNLRTALAIEADGGSS